LLLIILLGVKRLHAEMLIMVGPSPTSLAPLPTCLITHSPVSLAEHTGLYHQRTTSATTDDISDELTQEGQNLTPPRCKGWSCYGLGIGHSQTSPRDSSDTTFPFRSLFPLAWRKPSWNIGIIRHSFSFSFACHHLKSFLTRVTTSFVLEYQ
jgi:hypothetical protein